MNQLCDHKATHLLWTGSKLWRERQGGGWFRGEDGKGVRGEDKELRGRYDLMDGGERRGNPTVLFRMLA